MVPIISVPGDESVKPYRRLSTSSGKAIIVLQGADHSAITQAMTNFNTDNSKNIENIETKGAISLVDEYEMRNKKDASRTTLGVIDGKHDECGQNINLTGSKEDQSSATKDHTAEIVVSDDEEYTEDNVLPDSRHGDASIYRDMDFCLFWWKKFYRIADRNETRVKFTSDCVMVNGSCRNHSPCTMMQIFSIELAKLPVDGGLVELYGYIAVRDNLDRLLNYVVNISRDDPITSEEGSLIKMVGPKRGIYLMDFTLLEYDIKLKTQANKKKMTCH